MQSDANAAGLPTAWPTAGGETGARIRAHDWSKTPLGPTESWPQSLRTAVEICLGSALASAIFVGPDLIDLHNDRLGPIMGAGHLEGLGRPAREVWAAAWNMIGPMLEWVLRSGESVLSTDLALPVARNGTVEDASFIFSYGPLRDESGRIAGVLVMTVETTARVRAESRRDEVEAELRQHEAWHGFLLRLGDTLRPLTDPAEIQAEASRLLRAHLRADRACYSEPDEPFAPGLVHGGGGPDREISRAEGSPWGDCAALGEGRPDIVADVAASPSATAAARGPWEAIGLRAWIRMPLVKAGHPVACLTVGQLSPRDWTPSEVALVEEVAERTWDAVGRARAEAALRESEARFRSFAENSADVLWIIDARTRRLEYLSPAFEQIWGEPRDRILDELGRWAELVHPDDREQAVRILPRLLAGEAATIEYRIVRASDGAVRSIRDAGFPIRDEYGQVRRAAGFAQDITEQRQAERRIDKSEHRLRSLVEGIPQLVWRATENGEWAWSSPQWSAYTGLSEEESRAFGWLEALHPDDRVMAMAAWRQARASQSFEVEYRIRHAATDRHRWFTTRATPVREDGQIVEWLGTSTDVDELRGLQEHQKLLLAELQHRVRNTLAVVRSIARRTAQTSETVDDYTAHFDSRLNAFARTQAMVTRNPAAGVDLAFLVAEELVAHGARDGEQVSISGPKVRLQPKPAQTFGLAVHELASNAVKHGALISDHGHVDVRWRIEAREAEASPYLVFGWRERAACAVASVPRRKGFGTELLERVLTYELGARTSLSFAAEGFRCTIEVPLTSRIVVGRE